ncbi:magnesium chelatase [Saccharomonospora piscinae]|uniref:Magnesium chelatase n=1 Tax=Saccharomonospora piscinae TaxID=687388 RepID=A0A1V9A0I3_SACPI|nr:PPE domain-containing protein [Saccharomonospora piscinae]OQO90556.1 magnesium chelatase [Saccharomonospora piscinae]
MNDVDISAHAERIREHRFTGYTNGMLADEIELFRAGRGIAGISEAVAALQTVSRALAETDATLRRKLTELGVEWGGAAGERASSAVRREADFSEDAGEKVADSAERVFAQGEAFNRALHSLPDPGALRARTGEPGILDFAASLLGFEVDQVRALERAMEAREQAIQALNAYAHDSGANLAAAPELGAPARLVAELAEPVPESINAGGGPGDVTTAASAPGASAPGASAPPVSGPSATPVPQHTPSGSGVVPSSVVPPVAGAPTPGPAGPATGSGRGTIGVPQPAPAPSATAPSAAGSSAGPSGAAAGASAGAVGAAAGAAASERAQRGGPVKQGTSAPVPPPATGAGVPGSPGAPGTSAGPGGADAASDPANRSVRPGVGAVGGSPSPVVPVPPGGGGARTPDTPDAAPLGRGTTTGAVTPGPAAPGASSGSGTPGVRGGLSANDLGGGIAALGAGGVAGALSGGERGGRGVGRSAPQAARSPHPLAVGDLPEEEARVQRSSERLGQSGSSRRDAYLERAAPGEEDDGEHVRRFGVDDSDLFTDQRMVAPDVIGDDGADGRL